MVWTAVHMRGNRRAMDVAARCDWVAGVADCWNRGCMSVASDARSWNTRIEWVGAEVRLVVRGVR